ncbi:hypothetical protein GCM10025864_24750 [Luteimicrobium album]|uniref:FAD-binding PCMH-type domain-containing protein n=1 Tax=Luteimicrobium album TaxID=1054550 RepID=A0ABQ6I1R8_9MICO|nr:FAD-binding oxidoreductase [Luteimicrobium album]GMA24716.1 hypothetical protein GCM10025864_24750 [Luteimicrobium album]
MTPIDEVRKRLGEERDGLVVTPRDAGFDDVARVVFAGDGAAPALVARPCDVGEVSAVVRAAAATGVPFAVRGGGHGYARYGTVAGGLVLDLRLLGGVRIDPVRRVGTASAGTTAGDYTGAAAVHGLATGFGDTLGVGVPGLALGGGIGYLSRRDGLTLDNVLGAEVVLADGTVVRASDDENPELFWALRGGGGNFGVVTRLHLRLTPTTVVTGGLLAFAPDPRTVGALLAAAAAAPDELSLMVNVMKAPPARSCPPNATARRSSSRWSATQARSRRRTPSSRRCARPARCWSISSVRSRTPTCSGSRRTRPARGPRSAPASSSPSPRTRPPRWSTPSGPRRRPSPSSTCGRWAARSPACRATRPRSRTATRR